MYDEIVKSLRTCADDCNSSCKYHGVYMDSFTEVLLDEAANAIEELQQMVDASILKSDAEIIISEVAKAQPKWIPIEEQLPEEWKTVLTFQPTTTDDKGIIQTCVYIGIPGKWRQAWNHEFLELPVTHWMPLPEPPKGET